jgi:glycosyltransferase involved in cell wall biosynthesis
LMKISVVIPVRNEEQSIQTLLSSLCAQTRPPDEIVVVDGGSTDQTIDLIKRFDGGKIPVRFFCEGQALPGRGRNVGAANAAWEWLAFIDAGIKPEPNWLEELEKRAEADSHVDVIYGAWQPITDSPFKECAAIAYVPAPVEIDGVRTRPRSIASSLMRKSVWQAVGGFPENLRSAEDLLFMNEIERAGFMTAFAPQALVHWDIQPDLSRTFRRFVAYSRHNIRAGLWRQWQLAIFKRYLFLTALALVSLNFGIVWLAVPVCLWLALLVTRAILSIRRNGEVYPAGTVRNLGRIPTLILLLATLDFAAVAGSLQWLIKDKLFLHSQMAGAKNGA